MKKKLYPQKEDKNSKKYMILLQKNRDMMCHIAIMRKKLKFSKKDVTIMVYLTITNQSIIIKFLRKLKE